MHRARGGGPVGSRFAKEAGVKSGFQSDFSRILAAGVQTEPGTHRGISSELVWWRGEGITRCQACEGIRETPSPYHSRIQLCRVQKNKAKCRSYEELYTNNCHIYGLKIFLKKYEQSRRLIN